jgi:hypothetical protein
MRYGRRKTEAWADRAFSKAVNLQERQREGIALAKKAGVNEGPGDRD